MNKRTLTFLLATALTLTALWWLWPKPDQVMASPDTSLAQAGSTLSWQIADGRRVAGPERFALREGDAVMLEISTDHADELHIHGDDLMLALPAGETVRKLWQPLHAGRFEMELHHAGLTLTQAEVLPR